MNLNRISLRFLFSEKKYSYTNISIYISGLTFSLAIAISLVVMGISRSYKNDVETSLQSIEPEIIVTPLLNQYISASHIDSVYIKLDSISKSNLNLFFSKFREEYVMAKNSVTSSGLIAYMLEDLSLIHI